MLNEEKQEISSVSNSTVNQAKGNIINNYGINTEEVFKIVKLVVADKMVVFQEKAENTARQRLNEFTQKLINELQNKAEEQIGKFNLPAVQLAARKAAWGYVQSGDANEKDNLVDLLLERVSAEEKTTKQHLIDEAIEILPVLSMNCLRLLTLLAFSKLMKVGTVFDYEKWINSINPIIENITKISVLDVQYLSQADCTYSMAGFHFSDSFIDNQLKTCDLLFRHKPSKEFIDKLLVKHNITRVNDCFQSVPGADINKTCLLIDIFGLMNYPDVKVTYTTLSNVCDGLLKRGFTDISNDLHDYYNQTQPYTREEVEQYFISRNPHWKEALDLLKRDDISSLSLKPVGAYIACRQLSKLTGEEVSIDIFY